MTTPVDRPAARVSVVVPAHDEERVVGRLLDAVAPQVEAGLIELVVACNGCTDGTADLVRSRLPSATVLELAESSKYAALIAGDRQATVLPRVYVDADVVISGSDLLRLADRLSAADAPLAVAPRRVMDLTGADPVVRGYYAVWERLGAVQRGLYGRGVLAVGETGFARIADRPDVTGDDLYVDLAFGADEREIVEAVVSEVRAPRRAADLVRRRVRAVEGNREQYEQAEDRDTAGGSLGDVLRIARADGVRGLPDVGAFLAVTAAARGWARWRRWRGSESTWQRDESSRT